jgi:urease accessory protein
MTCFPRRAALVLAWALGPQLAHAHLISTGLGPVYDGVTHLALSPEDVLPIIALAVFAGLRGNGHARFAVLALPLAWFLGGIMGAAAGIAVPGAISWLPLLVLGGLVAADIGMSVAMTTALALILGAGLGLANGSAMAQAGAGLRGVAGSVAAVFVIATLAAAAASAWHAGWLRIAWRVSGSWIAAGGLLLLGWALR